MRRIRRLIYLAMAPLVLAACGAWLLVAAGAQSAMVHAAPAEPATASVTLSHYAPFAAGPLSTSVTIRLGDGLVFTEVVFAQEVTGLALPAGVYTVEVTSTGAGTPLLTATRGLSEGVGYRLAVIGGANGWPLDLLVLAAGEPPTVTAHVRVTHLSPFAPALPATAVDICTQGGAPVPGLTGITYGQSSGYQALAPGLYDLKVAAAGSNCATPVLDLPLTQLAPGQTADIFVIGLPGSLGLPLQMDAVGLAARAAFGHFAPLANTVISTSVTVRLAGENLLTGFVYEQLTPYSEVPLGRHSVEIIPTGATAPILTGTAVISGYVDYTFAVIGDRFNQPLELIRLVDDNVTPPSAGHGRLRLSHYAPIAGTPVGTRVDLCNKADKSILANDLTYRDTITSILPAGVYRVYVSAGIFNCALPLLDVPPFAIREGRIAYAYAIGDVILQQPTLVVRPDLTPFYEYLPSTRR